MRIKCICVIFVFLYFFSPMICVAQQEEGQQNNGGIENVSDALGESSEATQEVEWVIPDGIEAEDVFSDEDDITEIKPVVEFENKNVIELAALNRTDISLPDPLYIIEEIRVTGNSMTSKARIRSILQIAEGQEIKLSTLENAKARLATLGAFDVAEVRLLPGSDKGYICIEIRLNERMHLQIHDYYVGLSDKSQFWLGLNTSFLNPLGSGHRFNLSFASTPKSEYVLNFNYVIPNILGSNFFVSLGIHSAEVQEELFVRTKYLEQVSAEYRRPERVGIGRHGFTLFAGLRPLSVLSLTLGVQWNMLYRQDDKVQDEKRNTLDDYILSDQSLSTTGFASLIFDTRKSQRMPEQGHLAGLNIGGTFRSSISNYKYFRAFLFHQSNFTLVPEHILRLMSSAGAIVGDAPYYDKFQYADFYALNPARIGIFKPSSKGSFDIFKTGSSDLGYEDFIVNIGLEYAWQKILLKANIRRLELYLRLNATYADSLHVSTLALGNDPNGKERGVFPVDGGIDVGVRFETEYGFFKVSLGYILNMVPR